MYQVPMSRIPMSRIPISSINVYNFHLLVKFILQMTLLCFEFFKEASSLTRSNNYFRFQALYDMTLSPPSVCPN